MVDFKKLKNRSSAFDKLKEQLEKTTKTSYADPDEDTYWKPTRDAAGNAFAIIRFLPGLENEDPWEILYNYGFEGPTGQWYIENSRTTIGQADPCDEYYWKLWNSDKDENSPTRKQASTMRRRQNYITNIVVIKDSGNPDNNGKVFRYKFGPKIWGKIQSLMVPTFEDETPVDPFDYFTGANFRLKVTGKGRDTSYEKSEFESPSPLYGGDEEKIMAVDSAQYSLKEIVAPHKFKEYDKLQARLFLVLGLTSTSPVTTTAAEELPEADMDMSKLGKETDSVSVSKEKAAPASAEEDDDDDLAFFKSLAEK